MEQAIVRTSRMPIWAGVILGGLVGLAGGAHLTVALPLGFVLGYVLYARDRALSDNKQLHARVGGLLERVSLLEYSLKNLRRNAPAAHDAVPEAPPDIVLETSVAPIVEAALEARRSEVSLDKPWVTEPRKSAAVAPNVTSPAAARPGVAPSKSAAPSLIDNAIAAVRSWLFGGNTVARVGLRRRPRWRRFRRRSICGWRACLYKVTRASHCCGRLRYGLSVTGSALSLRSGPCRR